MVVKRARLRVALAAGAFLAVWIPKAADALTLPPGFAETRFVSGLTAPTAMAFAPDGRLFVCEQSGRLRVVKTAPTRRAGRSSSYRRPFPRRR